MAGTITVTPPDNTDRFNRPIQKWVITWATTSGGAFSQPIGHKINGTLIGIETVPDAGGTQPSSYGFTLTDEQGRDVAGGLGVTRSTTVTEIIAPIVSVTVNSIQYPRDVVLYDNLTLAVTSAGNSKGGTMYLYVR